MASPFSSREFHYLVAPNRYQQDYYANFVADPDNLLTGQLLAWLSGSGLFVAVVDSSSSVAVDRSLQCIVTELCGDMSDPAAPSAVIAARFFLLDESRAESHVLLTRDYREVAPIEAEGPDALAEAWGRCLSKILTRLTSDLSKAPE